VSAGIMRNRLLALEESDDRPRSSLKDLIVSTIYFHVPVD